VLLVATASSGKGVSSKVRTSLVEVGLALQFDIKSYCFYCYYGEVHPHAEELHTCPGEGAIIVRVHIWCKSNRGIASSLGGVVNPN